MKVKDGSNVDKLHKTQQCVLTLRNIYTYLRKYKILVCWTAGNTSPFEWKNENYEDDDAPSFP